MTGGAVGQQIAAGGTTGVVAADKMQHGDVTGALNTAGAAAGTQVGGSVGDQIASGTQTVADVSLRAKDG